MLDSIRNLASGWVAQLLLAILVISFAVWGVSDIFTGFGQNAVARVGGNEIPVREFQRRYQLATQALLQQLNGQNVTPQQLVQFGLPTQVLDGLVVEHALNDAAQRMGLGLSDKALGQQIANDPAFVSPTGQFDRNYLAQIIASQQMTQADFVADQRNLYVRQQITDALGRGNTTPEVFLRALHEYRDTARTISYVVVTGPTADALPDPSDADLTAYFMAHQADWKAPEYRAVNFFVLSPAELANPDEVTDEDAKKRYDNQPDLFRIPSQRQVQQIVFKDKADAEAAQKELAEGKTFDEVAKARNLQPSDYDLGFITKDKIIDPAVANVAFSIPENSVSPIIDGRFGPVIVNVRGVQEEIVISFEDSKADLKQQIATERATADILNIRDQIEDARAGGASLAEAAGKFDLPLNKIPAMDNSGRDPMGNSVPGLPVAVLTGAFAAEVGKDNDPVEPDRNSYAWYEVTGITPPHDRTLDEVRDRVVAAWKTEQRQKALDAKVADIQKRLNAGETLAAVAASEMLMVQTAENLTRVTNPSGEITSAGLTDIFAVDKGKSGVTRGATQFTSLVFTVDNIVEPPFDPNDATASDVRKTLNQQIMTDLLAVYAGQLRDKIDVRYNQAAVAAAVGVTPTSTP